MMHRIRDFFAEPEKDKQAWAAADKAAGSRMMVQHSTTCYCKRCGCSPEAAEHETLLSIAHVYQSPDRCPHTQPTAVTDRPLNSSDTCAESGCATKLSDGDGYWLCVKHTPEQHDNN